MHTLSKRHHCVAQWTDHRPKTVIKSISKIVHKASERSKWMAQFMHAIRMAPWSIWHHRQLRTAVKPSMIQHFNREYKAVNYYDTHSKKNCHSHFLLSVFFPFLFLFKSATFTSTSLFTLSLLKLMPKFFVKLTVFFRPNSLDDIQPPPSNRHPVREVPSQASFLANVKRCAEPNQLYCTNDTSYPTDHIEKLLRKYIHKFADVFGSDSMVNEVSTRIDGFDEIQLCDYTEKLIFPTSGQRLDGTELYIFNTPEHKQGVRVSICRNLGQPCHMSEGFPNSYRTECKQHMVYRELLSLSPDGVPIKEKFKFPACCSCAVFRV